MKNTKDITVLGADPSTGKAILIKVKNAADLARSQGALASFAQALAPASIESKVYQQMASELGKALKEKSVDADISIVEPAGWQPAGMGHVWTDVGFAIGGAGIIGALWWLLSGRKK
jgi:hypothetical protein